MQNAEYKMQRTENKTIFIKYKNKNKNKDTKCKKDAKRNKVS